MESSIVLLCKYGSKTLVVSVRRDFCFDDVVRSLVKKWPNLETSSFQLLYAVGGHDNCVLDNDADFVNMFALAGAYGVSCIDVVVEVLSSCADHNNRSIVVESVECRRSFEVGQSSTMHEVEEDPLERFCQHHETVRLSAGWAKLITHVGQEFRGGVKEFRDCLAMYAIEVGFVYKFLKNDKTRVTAECSKKHTESGCQWFIHATIERSNSFFCIREFEKNHSCVGVFASSKNPRMSSKLVAKQIREEVRTKTNYAPIEAVKFFEKYYGSKISYHHAWFGVEKAGDELYGDYALSFDLLRWYAEVAKEKNPGSVIDVEYCDKTNCFRRIFVAFDACIKGFNYCRPLLALDGTFLKGRYIGTLFGAIGKDGDQGLFPVAFGIADSETDENWLWFLRKLSTILSSRPITFITDRHSGLLKGIPEVFPNGYHAYCLQHLKCNLRDKFKGRLSNGFRDRVVELFSYCAYAPSISDYEEAFKELCNVGGPKAKDFVESLPLDKWANAYFEGRRYGDMCSNPAESFNKWILEARHLPILNAIDTIRVKLMEQMCDRRQQSWKWNGIVCPEMDKKLVTSFNKGRSWTVAKASEDVFEVFSLPTVVVDVQRRTCTCCRWQLNGFPCVHAVTAIQKVGLQVSNYIDPFYTVEAFRLSYDSMINPIPTLGAPEVTKENRVVLPPKTRRPRGRPKVQRIRSKGEKVRQIRCGRCGKLGNHNRKRCKEPIE
ncbi:uncharacterized protein LOC131310955 [Rhododendron vialii]|uniref:uncharacterized protein LOC131310955 n=1 Tax=Rhododendron vialii TaxID=182163 RepID=UPI002660009F|nr:uncharacterized protein LOC131310955 [Rhododendron vialii]